MRLEAPPSSMVLVLKWLNVQVQTRVLPPEEPLGPFFTKERFLFNKNIVLSDRIKTCDYKWPDLVSLSNI